MRPSSPSSFRTTKSDSCLAAIISSVMKIDCAKPFLIVALTLSKLRDICLRIIGISHLNLLSASQGQ
jgi:hypothetical protein